MEFSLAPRHWYVYLHTTAAGEPFYCGKGRNNRAEKWKRNPYHDRVVAKYGIIVQRLASFYAEQDAYDFEIEMIAHYRLNMYAVDYEPSSFATNMDGGGRGRRQFRHTEEHKLKLRATMATPESKQKQCRASLDVQNRPEVRQKKSENQRKPHSWRVIDAIDDIKLRIDAGEAMTTIAKQMDVPYQTFWRHVRRLLG